MVAVQNWPFFQLFSQANVQTRKMSFTIFQNDKMPFQAIKTTSSKCRNIDIFPKWVNPWFWSKNGHFSNLFVRQIQASKISFLIFQDEKTPFQAIKKESSKSQKLTFFQTIVLVQKWPYFQLVFLGNIGQENVFYDILEQKNAFLGCENKKLKNSKKLAFLQKGLTHGCGPKMAIFTSFFFKQIQARKISLTIFQNEKTPFLEYKTTSSKTRKIHIFSHGFGPKIGHF